MMRLAGLVVVIAVCTLATAVAQPVNGFSNWTFDELTLANGAKFQGMIIGESEDGYRFQAVFRPPGRPTVTLTSFFAKSEVTDVKRLTEKDRKVLKQRLAELDPSGKGERQRMESLETRLIDWQGKVGAGRRYESEFFTLESSGTEELTRRSAVRLEQIYTAFSRFLIPTDKPNRPTLIQLATEREEYRTLLGPLGGANLLNPAVFDPRSNRILCWSDLTRLGSELQTAQLHHSQQLASLKQYEESVAKLYKQPELDRFLAPVNLERKRVWTADQANGMKFDQATARLFATLYHEAFHAYVATFVFPALKPEEVKAGKGTGELPRWLNEGLAQVFETSVVEAGELRADSPNPERLARVKDWLKGKGGNRLVPLPELLSTGRDAFLAVHSDQKAASDRAYLTSWALAYYLTFDRRVIGTPEFRRYLIAINSGGDPRQAFAALVGQEPGAFEPTWHTYLLKLNRDGKVSK